MSRRFDGWVGVRCGVRVRCGYGGEGKARGEWWGVGRRKSAEGCVVGLGTGHLLRV